MLVLDVGCGTGSISRDIANIIGDARDHMVPFPPSSPCMALFKDGELVHMLERHHIEGRPAELIAENLMNAYNEHC